MKSVLVIIVLVIAAATLLGYFTPQLRPILFSIVNLATGMMEPKFKEDTVYDTGTRGFQCSQPIRLQRQLKMVNHRNSSTYEFLYLPIDQAEADRHCKGTWVE